MTNNSKLLILVFFLLIINACKTFNSQNKNTSEYTNNNDYILSHNPSILDLKDCSLNTFTSNKDSTLGIYTNKDVFDLYITTVGQYQSCTNYTFNDSIIIKIESNVKNINGKQEEVYSKSYIHKNISLDQIDSLNIFYHIINVGSKTCATDKLISLYKNGKLQSRVYYSGVFGNTTLPDLKETAPIKSLLLNFDSSFAKIQN